MHWTEQPAGPRNRIAAPGPAPIPRNLLLSLLVLSLLLLSLPILATALGPRAIGQGAPATQPASPPPYVILLDAAHGGSETGARLSDQLLEKDLTLALSVRLRSVLSAHGMSVVTTRESDTDPLPEQRAALANRTHPAACLLLHATTAGTGAHLYTSALPGRRAPAPANAPSPFLPWATAQAAFLTESLELSSDLRLALSQAGVPVVLGSLSLQPVDSMACPAVILEVAPLLARRGKASLALGTPEYETRLVQAIDGALEQWRAEHPVANPTAASGARP